MYNLKLNNSKSTSPPSVTRSKHHDSLHDNHITSTKIRKTSAQPYLSSNAMPNMHIYFSGSEADDKAKNKNIGALSAVPKNSKPKDEKQKQEQKLKNKPSTASLKKQRRIQSYEHRGIFAVQRCRNR